MTFTALVIPVSVLFVLLGMAVASDVRQRRISNRLVLCGLILALALHAAALSGGGAGLAGSTAWAPLSGLLAGGLALLPLYLARACGAGDVKLMAMVGAFVGLPTVLVAALCTLIAGGVLSLAFMLARGIAARTLANLRVMLATWSLGQRSVHGLQASPLEATACRLPYAVAIACGTVCALASHVSW